MPTNPVQKIFILSFIILALANLFISLLTIVVKAQKYGITDTWENPDGFALGTLATGVACLGIAYWFYRKKI